MPPKIQDPELLRLLGEILIGEIRPTAKDGLRLRLLRPGFSWQSLVDLASGQDVLPVLVRALAANRLLLPMPRAAAAGRADHATARLELAYREHLAQRQAQAGQLERIIRALNEAGIAPLILKGGRYLRMEAGAWSEARAMRDLDLLVRPDDGPRAVAALKSAGYDCDPLEALNYHHYPELRCPGEPASVEIHTEALAVAAQKIMPTKQVWWHAREIDAGAFFVLPLRWHALHGLLHHQVSDHGYGRQILAIKAVWEWTMLTRDFSPDDWEAVTAHMRAASALPALGSWLVQSHRLFGVEIPSFVEIPSEAYAQADATLRLACAPYWRRRTKFIAEQLRFSFARETLAQRYGIAPSDVSLRDAAKHLGHLVRLYRGRGWRRLIGHQDRLS